MKAIELKTELHKILEGIDDEQLLRTIYDFLTQAKTTHEGEIWDSLTDEQRKEVYLSYQESENEDNLIDWEDVKRKF